MLSRIYVLFVLGHRIGNKTTYCPHLMGCAEGVELADITDYLWGRDDDSEEDYYVLESPHIRVFSSETVALKCYAELINGYLECETLRYEEYQISGNKDLEIIM